MLTRLITLITLSALSVQATAASAWYEHITHGSSTDRSIATLTWEGKLPANDQLKTEMELAIGSADPNVKKSAAVTLGYADALPAHWRVDALARLLKNESSHNVRNHIITALASIASVDPSLLTPLLDQEPVYRLNTTSRAAAVALAISRRINHDSIVSIEDTHRIHEKAISELAIQLWPATAPQPSPQLETVDAWIERYESSNAEDCKASYDFIDRQSALSAAIQQGLKNRLLSSELGRSGCLLQIADLFPSLRTEFITEFASFEPDQKVTALQLHRLKTSTRLAAPSQKVLSVLLSAIADTDDYVADLALRIIDEADLWAHFTPAQMDELQPGRTVELARIVWRIRSGNDPVNALRTLLKNEEMVERLIDADEHYDFLFRTEMNLEMFTSYFDDVIQTASNACVPRGYLHIALTATIQQESPIAPGVLLAALLHEDAKTYLTDNTDCPLEYQPPIVSTLQNSIDLLWLDDEIPIAVPATLSVVSGVFPDLTAAQLDEIYELEDYIECSSARLSKIHQHKLDPESNHGSGACRSIEFPFVLATSEQFSRLMLPIFEAARADPERLEELFYETRPWFWLEYRKTPRWLKKLAKRELKSQIENASEPADDWDLTTHLVRIQYLSHWMNKPAPRFEQQATSAIAHFLTSAILRRSAQPVSLAEVHAENSTLYREIGRDLVQFEPSHIVRQSVLNDQYLDSELGAARSTYRRLYYRFAPAATSEEMYDILKRVYSKNLHAKKALSVLNSELQGRFEGYKLSQIAEQAERQGDDSAFALFVRDTAELYIASLPVPVQGTSQRDTHPDLPALWPIPQFSERSLATTHQDDLSMHSLERVNRQIHTALHSKGYIETGIFGVPNGFSIVTGLERVDENLMPIQGDSRFLPVIKRADFGTEWFRQLIFGFRGDFRAFMFVVTDAAILEVDPENRNPIDTKQGALFLPADWKNQPMNDRSVYFVVFHFEKINGHYRLNPDSQPALKQLNESLDLVWAQE